MPLPMIGGPPGAMGLRPALDPAERGELTAQLGLLVAPQRAQGVDPLVGAAAAGLEGHADRLVLARHVPHADADLEATLREHVDRRQLLGQDDRVAQRQDHDAGAERDARRDRGGVGEDRDRVHELGVRRQRRRRRVRVDEHRVLADPDRVEAELSAVRATSATLSASARTPDPNPNHPIGIIDQAACVLRWWRACALPTCVMTSTTNARITMNQPKPVTPLIGA